MQIAGIAHALLKQFCVLLSGTIGDTLTTNNTDTFCVKSLLSGPIRDGNRQQFVWK